MRHILLLCESSRRTTGELAEDIYHFMLGELLGDHDGRCRGPKHETRELGHDATRGTDDAASPLTTMAGDDWLVQDSEDEAEMRESVSFGLMTVY